MISIFGGRRGLGEKQGAGMILEFKFRDHIADFPGSTIKVFLCIALHSDENGHCWPNYDTIIRETGLARSTVGSNLKSLCDMQIQGCRVLARFRVRDDKGQYIGSNHYLIFPTPEELATLDLEPIQSTENVPWTDTHSTENPTVDKPNGGKIALKDKPLNIKDKPDLKCEGAASQPPAHRTDAVKKGDMMDGILAYQSAAGYVDVDSYSEDVRPILAEMCRQWCLIPPTRTGKKGDPHSVWEKESGYLKSACGEFGPEVLVEVRKIWTGDPPGRPGTLITWARSTAGKMRQSARPAPAAHNTDDLAARRAAFQAAPPVLVGGK